MGTSEQRAAKAAACLEGGPRAFCAAALEEKEEENLQNHVRLLQRSFRARVADNSPWPIHWLHVPKSGSSLINALIHIPGACPGIPSDLDVNAETFGESLLSHFQNTYPPVLYCPGFMSIDTGWHVGSALIT